LRKLGRDGAGTLWALDVCPDLHAHRGLSNDSFVTDDPVKNFRARGWGRYGDFVNSQSAMLAVIKASRVLRSIRHSFPK